MYGDYKMYTNCGNRNSNNAKTHKYFSMDTLRMSIYYINNMVKYTVTT